MENKDFKDFLLLKNQEYLQKNDVEILNDLDQNRKELLLKISNFMNEKMTEEERKTISEDDLINLIKNNLVVRSFFRKDPTKQSIHENTQFEWIKNNKYIDLIKLPASRKGLYFHNFELTTKTPRPENSTKTIDGFVKSLKIYCIFKFSTTSGGAQDNQFNDVKNFITQIIGFYSNKTDADEIFEFYLDGDYYTNEKKHRLELMIPNGLHKKIVISSAMSVKRKI